MKKVIASLFALLFACAAHAGTQCTSTLKYMEMDTGSTPSLRALTDAGVGFEVLYTDANQKAIAGLAAATAGTGQTISLYFTANSVSCTSTVYRTDLVWFHVGGV